VSAHDRTIDITLVSDIVFLAKSVSDWIDDPIQWHLYGEQMS